MKVVQYYKIKLLQGDEFARRELKQIVIVKSHVISFIETYPPLVLIIIKHEMCHVIEYILNSVNDLHVRNHSDYCNYSQEIRISNI